MFRAIFLWILLSFSSAERFLGTVNPGSNSGFSFLAKWVCDYRSTMVKTACEVDVEIAVKDPKQMEKLSLSHLYFVLFDDERNSWRFLRQSALSCKEKLKFARFTRLIAFDRQGDFRINVPIHEHIRPRVWYGTLLDCSLSEEKSEMRFDFELNYMLHFFQRNYDIWNREFGSNDRGLNSLYTAFAVLYIMLASFQYYSYRIYKEYDVHHLVRLNSSVVFCQCLSEILHAADWLRFTFTGWHDHYLRMSGDILEIFAATAFLMLLFLIAQGWTISNIEIKHPNRVVCICVITAVLQIGFFFWREYGLDPESAQSMYNAWPNVLYSFVMLGLGITYMVQILNTWAKEIDVDKSQFYLFLSFLYLLWFICPAMLLAIVAFIGENHRDFWAILIWQTMCLIGYGVMCGLMWPQWSHKYFTDLHVSYEPIPYDDDQI